MIISRIRNKPAQFAHSKSDVRPRGASQIHKRAYNLRISQLISSNPSILSKQHTRIIWRWRRLAVAILKTTQDLVHIVRLKQGNPTIVVSQQLDVQDNISYSKILHLKTTR